MPTVYAAGTMNASGYYPGINCASPTALLEAIRNTLSSAGWTITSDQIASNRLFIARGVDNAHNCWVEFSVVNTVSFSNHRTLRIRGDRSGTGADFSPYVTILFYDDGNLKLYLSANDGAGCICLISTHLDGGGIHFGFLDRKNKNNVDAWMVGYIRASMNESYIARSRGNQVWKDFSTFFYLSGSETINNPTGSYLQKIDALTTAPFWSSSGSQWSNSPGSNHAYGTHNGAVDPDLMRAVLGRFGYLEGNTSNSSYTLADTTKAFPLPYAGDVYFARTGLASLPLGAQCKPSGSTATFLSVGNLGWQGFQIAA